MPHRPIVLGVVGDSAAGKTTLTSGMAGLLGRDFVTTICTDDYHRYGRTARASLGITPLHPDCNYIDIMEQHLRGIGAGEPILKPVYNHRTGELDPPEYVKPTRFVVVDGLLAFHTPELRDCFHVKVFLDPPEPLRRRWKIGRDCAKRGYTPEQVEREMVKREGDSASFIRPQKACADIVVQFYEPEGRTNPEQLNVKISLRSTLQHPDLGAIMSRVGSRAPSLGVSVGREDKRLTEYVDIDGRVTPDEAAAIEEAVWAEQPELRDLVCEPVGMFVDGQEQRRSLPLALVQLFIAYHLLQGRLEKEKLLEQRKRELMQTL